MLTPGDQRRELHTFESAYHGGWLDVRVGVADETELFVGIGWTILPVVAMAERFAELH